MSTPTGRRQYAHVVGFLLLYLGLSVVPFTSLHWTHVRTVLASYYPPDPLLVAVWVLGSLLLLAGLFVSNQGVERYVQFLFWPTDPLAALVDASFVWAAVSWWAIPEVAALLEAPPTLLGYMVGIVVSHVPAVVFLSLLTAVGEAHDPDKKYNQ